jgi:hypothetical protein
VKTGFPDQADFAMIRHLIHWRVLALRTLVGATIGTSRPSQRDMQTDLKPGHSKIRQNLPAVTYRAKPFGISRCDGRKRPMVTPTIVQNGHSRRVRSRVVAESAGSGEPVFYIAGCVTLWTVALSMPIFKQKIGPRPLL